MHIIVIVVNDIIVILKHISKLGTRKRLLNTKIEPNFTDSKKSNVDGGLVLDYWHSQTLELCYANLINLLHVAEFAHMGARFAYRARTKSAEPS